MASPKLTSAERKELDKLARLVTPTKSGRGREDPYAAQAILGGVQAWAARVLGLRGIRPTTPWDDAVTAFAYSTRSPEQILERARRLKLVEITGVAIHLAMALVFLHRARQEGNTDRALRNWVILVGMVARARKGLPNDELASALQRQGRLGGLRAAATRREHVDEQAERWVEAAREKKARKPNLSRWALALAIAESDVGEGKSRWTIHRRLRERLLRE